MADGLLTAGRHVVPWTARGVDGERLSGGVYFVRMQAADEVRMTRVVHLK